MNAMPPPETIETAKSLSPAQIDQLKRYALAGKAAELLLKDMLELNRQPDLSALKKSLAIFITNTADSLGLDILEQD